MYMLIDTASQLTRQAAWLHDQKDLRASTMAMSAKLLSSESASRIAHMALQVHGGNGYLVSTGIERMYRDIRYSELAKMSSEQLRVSIAKDVLGSLG
jgi:alkylation response protein AidB-like acyl-CoA dehydrogenase